MAGLLDSKERIFDFVLTRHGRKQLSREGQFIPSYASFSDMYAVYDFAASGTLFFEAPSDLPIDTISFEVGNAGGVFLNTIPGYTIKDGQLIEYDDGKIATLTKSILDTQKTGSVLLLTASLDSVKHNNILSSVFPEFELDSFSIEPKDISFLITTKDPFDLTKKKGVAASTIEAAEDIEEDIVFSHAINFMHLPPVGKTGPLNPSPGTKTPLGNYSKLSPDPYELKDIKDRLSSKQYYPIEFTESSFENNNILQFFEFSQDGGIKKLNIIDGGSFYYQDSDESQNNSAISNFSVKRDRILFVGKIFIDKRNAPTFINMFTMVLSNA